LKQALFLLLCGDLIWGRGVHLPFRMQTALCSGKFQVSEKFGFTGQQYLGPLPHISQDWWLWPSRRAFKKICGALW